MGFQRHGRFASLLALTLALSATACDRKEGGEESASSSQLAADEGVAASGTAGCNTQAQPPQGYPYGTWQGNEPNCVPRAFQTRTGVYDPSLLGGPSGADGRPTQWIDTGNQTFYGRGAGQAPVPGDVVYYDYDRKTPGLQGHAGVCTDYTADGQCIIATGHQTNPYDTRAPSELDQTYTPATPVH